MNTTLDRDDDRPVRIWISTNSTGSPAKRLARAVSGRPQDTFTPLDVAQLAHYPRSAAVNAETLDRLTEPGRVAAQVGLNDPGTLRALIDVDADCPRAVDVLPSRRGRLAATWRVIGGGLAVGALAVALLAPAPHADATVIPLTRPVVLVVSGPTTRLDDDVVSTAPTTRDGGHIVTLTDGPLTVLGVAGPTPLVHLGAAVASRQLTPGTTTATLTDVGDGTTTTIPITVLRQSRITASVQLVPGGGMLILGNARHYDATTGSYRGDLASPVAVQVFESGRWATAITATTVGADGAVAQLLTAPAGTWSIRLVRPAGATVTGATSGTTTLTVR